MDSFGNLVSSFREEDLPGKGVVIEVAGRRIEGPSRTYSRGVDLAAVIGSDGYLEIATPLASAARVLGVGVGERVTVSSVGGED